MHMQSNNDKKKYRFFDPFTGEAPLNSVNNRLIYIRCRLMDHESINIFLFFLYIPPVRVLTTRHSVRRERADRKRYILRFDTDRRLCVFIATAGSVEELRIED